MSEWNVFPVSRNGTDWSVRIDNGNGMAFELSLKGGGKNAGMDAIELADHIARTCRNSFRGNAVRWEGK